MNNSGYAPEICEQTKKVANFKKLNLASGKITKSPTKWDIAFRGQHILINGGNSTHIENEPERTGDGACYIETNCNFLALKKADKYEFKQDGIVGRESPVICNWACEDTEKSYDYAWIEYKYLQYDHSTSYPIVTPNNRKTIVIKTHNNRYAKLKIRSYHKGCPDIKDIKFEKGSYKKNRPKGEYYTIEYFYNPNKEDLVLKSRQQKPKPLKT